MKNSAYIFIIYFIAVFCLGWCTGYNSASDVVETRTDTVRTTDTIKDTNPNLVHDTVWKKKYVRITSRPDTVTKTDTVIELRDSVAIIPISLRTYTDSSTYKAVVSGYDPRLESIEVYQETTVITNTLVEESPRLSFGVSAGLAATPQGLQPAILVGANYRIGWIGKNKHKSKSNKK